MKNIMRKLATFLALSATLLTLAEPFVGTKVYASQTDGAIVNETSTTDAEDDAIEDETATTDAEDDAIEDETAATDAEDDAIVDETATADTEDATSAIEADSAKEKDTANASVNSDSNVTSSESDFTWDGNTIKAYTGSSATVVIPAKAQKIAAKAFNGNTTITSVDFSKSAVTYIGSSAFNGCTSLQKVTLPDSDYTDENSLTLFAGCTKLATVDLGDKVTMLPKGMFQKCSALKTITIPNSVKSIGDVAFHACTSLTTVNFGTASQLITIGNSAFYDDTALVNFDFTKLTKLQFIDTYCFYDCSALKTAVLPKTLESFGSYVFKNCTSLSTVEIKSTYLETSSSTHTKYTLYVESFAGDKALKTITLTEGLTVIPRNLFYGAGNITSIKIPSTVITIGAEAFAYCSNLASINIEDLTKLTSIGEFAFESCDKLTNVIIPSGVTAIGNKTFRGCDSLVSIRFNNPMTTIPVNIIDATNPTVIKIYGFTGSTAEKFVTNLTAYNNSLDTPATCSATFAGSLGTFKSVKITYSSNAYNSSTKLNTSAPSITGSMSAQTDYVCYPKSGTSYTTPVHLKANAYKSSGFTFVGWNTKANGSGKAYSNQAFLKTASNITLYAQWRLTSPTTPSVWNTSNGLYVKWSKVAKASGYYVYRSVNGGSYTKAYTLKKNSGTLAWTDTAASSNGQKYTYKVAAYYTSGRTWTSYSSATKTYYRVAPVTISSIKNSAAGTIALTWKKPSVHSGYDIQYSTASNFSGAVTLTAAASATSLKITGRTKGKTYYVRIRTYKTVNNVKYYSAWSTKSVKVKK